MINTRLSCQKNNLICRGADGSELRSCLSPFDYSETEVGKSSNQARTVCEREQFAGCTVKRTLVIYYLDEAPKRSVATNRAKRAVIKYPYAFSERGRESKSGEGAREAPRRREVVTSASGAEKTSPSMRRCGYAVTSLPAPLAPALTCPERVTNDGRGITTRKLRAPFVLSRPFVPTATRAMRRSGGLCVRLRRRVTIPSLCSPNA